MPRMREDKEVYKLSRSAFNTYKSGSPRQYECRPKRTEVSEETAKFGNGNLLNRHSSCSISPKLDKKDSHLTKDVYEQTLYKADSHGS